MRITVGKLKRLIREVAGPGGMLGLEDLHTAAPRAYSALTSGELVEPERLRYDVAPDGSVMGSDPDDFGETSVLWHAPSNALYFAELGWTTGDDVPLPGDVDDMLDMFPDHPDPY